MKHTFALLAVLLLMPLAGLRAAESASEADRYLKIVRAYADCMIEHGRDTYGKEHSPLFAGMLSRKTHAIFHYPFKEKTRRIEGFGDVRVVGGWADLKGIRHDNRLSKQGVTWGWNNDERMPDSANLNYDNELLSLLYLLSERTGSAKYAQAADETLRFFLLHCQDARTGLFAWGEHLGWHLVAETWAAPATGLSKNDPGRVHELGRPWSHWERCYQLGPEAKQATLRFALGQWRFQVGNHAKGLWNRHAYLDSQIVGRTGREYPRLIGQMCEIWAEAYRQTDDATVKAELWKAIHTVVDASLRRRAASGALPFGTEPKLRNYYNLDSNLIMLTLLHRVQALVPAATGNMGELLASGDDVVLNRLRHDLQPGGKGYLQSAHADTLVPGDPGNPHRGANPYSHLWSGKHTTATTASMLLERFQQTGKERYKELGIAGARLYLTAPLPRPQDEILMPFHAAAAIRAMLDAYRAGGDREFLDRAKYFAQEAAALFLDDTSPLPKVTSHTDPLHLETYLASTGGGDLMLALMQLSVALK